MKVTICEEIYKLNISDKLVISLNTHTWVDEKKRSIPKIRVRNDDFEQSMELPPEMLPEVVPEEQQDILIQISNHKGHDIELLLNRNEVILLLNRLNSIFAPNMLHPY